MAGRSIFGESFRPYVANQIKTRQKKLAKSNKYDQDTIAFINNSTSWLRLASGVNVNSARAKEIGVNLTGNKLASQYVLSSAYFNQKFTSGVGYDLSSTSYGFLSDPSYGLVPPPGLISAEIRPAGDKSTLRFATVQIECHNLSQFKVIEALYLRLKYSMLLEWGHTVWFDNGGELNKSVPNHVLNKFLKGDYNQDSLLKDLEKTRSDFSCNYDGFLGWVRNFTWNLKPNGGYDITLELVALGDVIESIKINTNYPQPSTTTTTTTSTSNGEATSVFPNKEKSTIHQILHAIKSELVDTDYLDGTHLSAEKIVEITKKHSGYDLVGVNWKHPNEKSDTLNNILTNQEAVRQKYDSLTTLNDNTTGYFYYIKLGTLLRIIESFLLKYDTSKGTVGTHKPIFYIDHDYNDNICLTLPRQISIDPRICVLKPSDKAMSTEGNSSQASAVTSYQKISFPTANNNSEFGTLSWSKATNEDSNFSETQIAESYTVSNNQDGKAVKVQVKYKNGQTVEYDSSNGNTPEFYINTSTYNTNNEVTKINESGVAETTQNSFNLSNLGDNFRVGTGYEFLGRFMHIHLNIDYISTLLSDNIDENGKVTLIKFLQQLTQGIQSATGHLNNFEIKYDELTNTFYIIDDSILPNADKLLNRDLTPVRINAHLLTDSLGSFVTNVSIKSNLNNNYAAQITAAAQSNSNVVGETATAFSKWNIGYTDRLITERSSVMDKQTQKSGSLSSTVETVYLGNLIKYASLANFIQTGTVTPEDITAYGSAVVDMLKYEINYFTETDSLPGPGFLPINLQLVMNGLSGPRLFETYTINETLLPDNYKNNIKFLTQNITHKIDSNGWVTTLDSFTAPDIKTLKKPIFYHTPEDAIMKRVKSGGNSDSGGPGTVQQNLKTWGSGHTTAIFNDTNLKRFPSTSDAAQQKSNLIAEINKLKNKSKCMGEDSSELYYKFINSLLSNSSLPTTYNNLWFCTQWLRAENTSAKFNPLATTQKAAGATNFNSVPVRNYPDFGTGLKATVETLTNRYYPILREALSKGTLTPVEIWNYATGGGGNTTVAAATTTSTTAASTAPVANTPAAIAASDQSIAASKGYPAMLTPAALAKLKAAGWPDYLSPQYTNALQS